MIRKNTLKSQKRAREVLEKYTLLENFIQEVRTGLRRQHLQIIQRYAAGEAMKQIAATMGLTYYTASSYYRSSLRCIARPLFHFRYRTFLMYKELEKMELVEPPSSGKSEWWGLEPSGRYAMYLSDAELLEWLVEAGNLLKIDSSEAKRIRDRSISVALHFVPDDQLVKA